MNNPYNSQNAESLTNKSAAASSSEKNGITFAIAVTASVGVLLASLDYLSDPSDGVLYTALSCVIIVFFSWYVVLAIHKLANGLGANGVERKLGAWGFIWRFYITMVSSAIPAIVTMMPFYPNFVMTRSISTSLISTALICLFVPCVVWVLFSNNRRQQLRRLKGLVSRV